MILVCHYFRHLCRENENLNFLGLAVMIDAVTATLLNFVRLFRKAHEENLKQAELEKKKAEKDAEVEKTEKAKGGSPTKQE